MKLLFKIIKWTIIVLVIIGLILCSYIYLKGRQMYNSAMEKSTLSQYVQNIRDNKDYLTIDDIPETYQNAVVAVEDHRFYDHNGFDIRGTTRAIINNIVTLSARERRKHYNSAIG